MTPHVISGQIKSKKIASQLDILTMIVLQHDAQMRSISFSTQYLLLVWVNVLCIRQEIYTLIYIYLCKKWAFRSSIWLMWSQNIQNVQPSVFLRHQCPQEWDAPVPGWHYLDARDRSRRLIAGGASAGDDDGGCEVVLVMVVVMVHSK